MRRTTMRMGSIALLLVCATGCGLLQHATKGAGDDISARAAAARENGCPHGECVAHAMVRGALDELDTPARREQLQAIIRTAIEEVLANASSPEHLAQMQLIAETAARSAVRGLLGDTELPTASSITDQTLGALRRSLGDAGDGPLAKSLAATAERISASTVRSIRDEVALFPECTGAGRARCIDARLTDLSRAASVGVRDGLRGVVALPLLALSFLCGLIVALLVALLVSHHRPSREPLAAGRRHRHATAH